MPREWQGPWGSLGAQLLLPESIAPAWGRRAELRQRISRLAPLPTVGGGRCLFAGLEGSCQAEDEGVKTFPDKMGVHTHARGAQPQGWGGPEASAETVETLRYIHPDCQRCRVTHRPLPCKSVRSLLGSGVDLATLTFWHFREKKKYSFVLNHNTLPPTIK